MPAETSSMDSSRPSWDDYFLNVAAVVATRSSCLRTKVGAVIVRDRDIVSTGYNGAPKYQPHCLELGSCYRDAHGIPSGTRLELCRAVGSHAESNAIALAARNGHSTRGTTMFIVGHRHICNQCKAQIANAGVIRVLLRTPEGEVLEFFPARDWTRHPIDHGQGKQGGANRP
ncbi:MAG: dCMP deaminase family protein [bacterium]|nr:dCMP deaminase family protein [candidate division KSB1 bacterium]MDH7561591.1 dCMP deaminase family protein [bacterium]